jgi:hypothetical protein
MASGTTSSTVTNRKDAREHRVNAPGKITDFFIEDLGLYLLTFGEFQHADRKAFFPAPGYSYSYDLGSGPTKTTFQEASLELR